VELTFDAIEANPQVLMIGTRTYTKSIHFTNYTRTKSKRTDAVEANYIVHLKVAPNSILCRTEDLTSEAHFDKEPSLVFTRLKLILIYLPRHKPKIKTTQGGIQFHFTLRLNLALSSLNLA
jgi:hypothetical protein